MNGAWDCGYRYFDTSPYYGVGLAEHRLGSFLREKPEDSYIVSTKIGRVLKPYVGPDLENCERGRFTNGLNFTYKWDFSYDGVMRSFEDSYQRTSIRKIDLLTIHDLDLLHHSQEERDHHTKDLEGGFKAMQKLKEAGLIKAIGVGVNDPKSLKNIMHNFDLDYILVAMMYNMLDQTMYDDEFKFIEKNQIGMIQGAPYASGILATGAVPGAQFLYTDATPESMEKTRRIEAVCKEYNVPLKAAALQFVLGHPLIASVIPGPTFKQHAIDNMNMLKYDIPGEFWTALKEKNLIDSRSRLEGTKNIFV